MAYPERLSEALRREVYSFILSIYEASGSVHQPGVLIKDIESGANKILVAAAKYPLAELKDKTIKDILSELKGLRALFGVARDMGLLNHERIRSVWSECTELEEEFSKILAGSGERPADSQIRADNSSKRAEKGINEAGDTSKTKGEASSKKEKIFKGSTAGERGQQPPITHHPPGANGRMPRSGRLPSLRCCADGRA
ncbi:MAG: hypothetical protein HY471_01550 [Candidatus Sungbacteria bacterium]|nr:hypothetical protein [Candidatus Sungbacteria bacterium]